MRSEAARPVRVLVVGAGPIGTYIAARLQAAGNEVALHGKGAGFERLARHGAVRLRPRDDASLARDFELNCLGEPPAAEGWDVLVLAVKAHALAGAAAQFSAHARTATTVLPQNGLPWWLFLGTPGAPLRMRALDPDGTIEEALPLERSVGCVVSKGLNFEGGTLMESRVASDRFTVGDVVAGSGCARTAAALLQRAHFPAVLSDDIRAEKWRKLLVNVAFNPLGAIAHLGFGEVLDVPQGARLARQLMHEAMAVARACGAPTDIDEAAAFARARSSRHHKTSMLQDVEAGRPMEIDAIVGALLELAQHHRVEVPTLCSIDACLRLIDHTLRDGPIRRG